MRRSPAFSAYAIPGIPLIQPGDDIVSLIVDGALTEDLGLRDGDVLVISSKVVSKSEGRQVSLQHVAPSARAMRLAKATDKDARLVELILRESRRVSRHRRGVLVTEHRLGFVSANSGLDRSNIESGDSDALMLPLDPDASAQRIRERLAGRHGIDVAVVISDTHGRPFRIGNVGVAIGVAGMPALKDLRGRTDLYGRELEITQQAYADLVASAAHLLCGEADEGYPAILIRGIDSSPPHGVARDLNRLPENDLYQ